MRTILRLLLKVGLVLAVLVGLLGAAGTASVFWQLYHLKLSRVPRDVERAIAAGDTRLLEIEGQAPIIPGVDTPLYVLASTGHCGVRVIYVGDRYDWNWEARLWHGRVAYANAFTISS